MKTRENMLARLAVVGGLFGTTLMMCFLYILAWLDGTFWTGRYELLLVFNDFGESFFEAWILSPILIVSGLWLVREIYRDVG